MTVFSIIVSSLEFLVLRSWFYIQSNPPPVIGANGGDWGMGGWGGAQQPANPPSQRGPEMTISGNFWQVFKSSGPEMSKISQLSCKWCNFWSALSRTGSGRLRPVWMRSSPHRELGPRCRGPGRRRRPGGPRFGEVPFPLLHESRFQRACAG